MALETSPDAPAPVRVVSMLLDDWIGRLGAIWIDGQIAQISRRPGMRTAWITLRDVEADLSLSVVVDTTIIDVVTPPIAEGQRVIVYGRPEFYTGRGQLQIRAREIRPVGRGALLEEIERVRALLQAEGLFAAERKRPLPFLPRRVGLISGRASAALSDVLVNTRGRWPGVAFEVREVAVQGTSAVTAVVDALAALNAVPEVDVIVIARGGGSVEDLLPFSNERLVRAVAASRAPVVSAIGHEQDVPLVDLAADLRASTPTDAAKRIVPDVVEEMRLVESLQGRARRIIRRALDTEFDRVIDRRERGRAAILRRVERGRTDIEHLSARLRVLSPAATLGRGYAVVRTADGRVVRSPADVAIGDPLDVRIADGRLGATVSASGSDRKEGA
ncbi:MAG: exodeoxyribonuclease VII large subunit [Actinobacteria bacterium]|nr:exodeoxyribonuclease VII large subunit [Actinomycetota bacterium]